MGRKLDPKRVRLGKKLRSVRDSVGMQQTQVARALKVTQSTMSSWECGKRKLPVEQAERLDELFGSSGAIKQAWNTANTPDALPPWYTEVGQLEREAIELREYQPVIFPGLVQCESYTKGLLADTVPWFSTTEVERMVALRMERQEILTGDNPPLVSVVVEEAVLHRNIRGGRKVLGEQIARVLTLIDEERIRFQVVPANAECHPGGSGPFRLYTFPDKPTIASAEHMEGEALMDDMMPVQHCATLFGVLQSEALSPRASLDLIRKVKEELDGKA
ncbi:helix-turn-helix transcriptional regulator [Nocardiopsis sp. HUAS JQ3]|uniref:helix-turn-helix domain-containing protein n=1 Tax=Nocardiopsis sp. HUAS JQ3 TaxID=3061629 RepID=UPI0023AA00B3|nr:helix-turn-helix transcriptional regulator [Nocardiopsis sp. HUAS JQ3]WDZ91580.1 helix-turn-helix transcriptional regulator [Nocardiopsis sp. HUAS JQ3]